jgi:hypothetical protein
MIPPGDWFGAVVDRSTAASFDIAAAGARPKTAIGRKTVTAAVAVAAAIESRSRDPTLSAPPLGSAASSEAMPS